MEAVLNELAYEEWFPRTGTEQQEVLAQLDLILASRHFRQSKRSAILLRFIVENTLKGHESILKERTLGVEVFGRTPDYDTNADPVVRMAAGEIRKRIAQYYHDSSNPGQLHIDLPSGSYVARFQIFRPNAAQVEVAPSAPSLPGEMPQPTATPAASQIMPAQQIRPSAKRRLLLLGCATCLLVAGLMWAYFARHQSPLDQAWGDVLAKNNPTLISAGEPNLYPLVGGQDAQPITGQLHLRNDSVSFSEVQAILRVFSFLDRRNGAYLQSAATTTFADLQRSPTILLGGLDNPWTIRAQQNLRFRMDSDGKGLDWIVDARNPAMKSWTVDFAQPYSALTNDYAIVARFFNPSTQEPTLIVAGLGENGTKAATEFITDPATLQRLAGDWMASTKGRNFEVVLETQLINGSYGPPKLLAKDIW